MKDILTSSCIAATVSFLCKNIINHIIYYMGITPFLYRVEAATLVLPIARANSISGWIIGLFVDLVLIAWFSLLIAYIIRVTGRDYAILKGAFVGGSSWLIVYGFFTHTGILGLFKPKGTVSGLTSIFLDITMGVVSAYVLVRLDGKVKV